MTTPNTGTPLALPPDAILIPADGLRRTPASEEAEMGFAISVAQLGVLQPILVRGAEEPGRYRLVAGRRRLRAAIAAGHATIPAVYRPDLSDADATAIEMAENVQRAAMAPLDQWRAITRLRDLGWKDPQNIADALGLPLRLVLRMQKLGDLHPSILDAIAAHGMPQDRFLTTIAAAPTEAQASAMARERNFSDAAWWRVAETCTVARIPRDRAIFDLQAAPIAWDEEAANMAARMLPTRTEAERQRDSAQAALRTLHAAIGGIVATGVETFHLQQGDTRVASHGERRFAEEREVQALIDRLAALLPPEAAPAEPAATNG